MTAIIIVANESKFISEKSNNYQITVPKQKMQTTKVSDILMHLSWTTIPPRNVLNKQNIVENNVYTVFSP